MARSLGRSQLVLSTPGMPGHKPRGEKQKGLSVARVQIVEWLRQGWPIPARGDGRLNRAIWLLDMQTEVRWQSIPNVCVQKRRIPIPLKYFATKAVDLACPFLNDTPT